MSPPIDLYDACGNGYRRPGIFHARLCRFRNTAVRLAFCGRATMPHLTGYFINKAGFQDNSPFCATCELHLVTIDATGEHGA